MKEIVTIVDKFSFEIRRKAQIGKGNLADTFAEIVKSFIIIIIIVYLKLSCS